MRKIIRLICMVVSLMMLLVPFTVNAEENMDRINDLKKYSAKNVEESIIAALGTKSDDTVIRVFNAPILFAFNRYDKIDEVLISDYIYAHLYLVIRNGKVEEFYEWSETESEPYRRDIWNSVIPNDTRTLSVLMGDEISKKLPEGAKILDVYYLSGRTNRMGSALYYITDVGDFVYYDKIGQYVFPADEFHCFMKDVRSKLGPDTPPGGYDIESVMDLTKYKIDYSEAQVSEETTDLSASKSALPYVCIAALAFGAGIAAFMIHQKKRTVKQGL